ncbi:hypothetical protein ACHQM5_023632 [Ranunculus cassubicifolius]
MARRSSGRPAPRPAARRPVQNAPAPASHAPPPAAAPQGQSGSLMGSIGSTIAQGMAFGAGSEVAHRAVEAVMGPRTIKHETVVSEATGVSSSAMGGVDGSNACKDHSKAFEDCLSSNGSDIGRCQFYLDMLSECRRNAMLNA